MKSDVRYSNVTESKQALVNQFKLDVDAVLVEKGLLTKREKEVLKVIAIGKTSEEIAIELNISKSTVDTHRQNMLRKYNVSNILELLQKCQLS